MKNVYLSLIAVIIIKFSFAQNTFPSSGNVGIGTTNPQQLLNINSGTTPGFSQLRITANSLGGLSATNFSPDNTGIGFDVDLVSGYWVARNPSVGWLYKANGMLSICGSVGNTVGGSGVFNQLLNVNLSNGYVGIGTTSPNTLLDVRNGGLSIGDFNLDPNYINLNFLANTSRLLIGQNRTGGENESDFIYSPGAYTGGFAFYNHDNNNNETQLMWIQGNGNVLIGRTSQNNTSYKLDVNGPAHATSIVVNSGGADFVFAPKYKLATLSFVEKYINQNHHLPEIPSAKQMEADGLNVGENQTKLLQKVEELTLYLIDKNKQLKTQQAEIGQLKQSAKADKEKLKELDLLKQQVQQLINASKIKANH